MPSIDFYILPHSGTPARLLFACRLLEKAYQQGHTLQVHLENADITHTLDALLWTFRDNSFIPHELSSASSIAPIQLGYNPTAALSGDILLNLHPEIPVFHESFKRVLEIMTTEPEQETLRENHRRLYEDRGYQITTHVLKG